MSGLDTFNVKVDGPEVCSAGHALPLQHQISRALIPPPSSGKSATPDLASLAFGGAGLLSPFRRSGECHVPATFDAYGPSTTSLIRFPGACPVPYFNSQGEGFSTLIEIAHLPTLPVAAGAGVEDSATAPRAGLTIEQGQDAFQH